MDSKDTPHPADNWYLVSVQMDEYTVEEQHFISYDDVRDHVYHALQHGVVSVTVRRV